MFAPHEIAIAAVFLAGCIIGHDLRPWLTGIKVDRKRV